MKLSVVNIKLDIFLVWLLSDLNYLPNLLEMVLPKVSINISSRFFLESYMIFISNPEAPTWAQGPMRWPRVLR